MAEEEVDWGMDESVDVDEWRQGAGEEAVTAGEEDVISLDGADDADSEQLPISNPLGAPRSGFKGLADHSSSRWEEACTTSTDLTS